VVTTVWIAWLVAALIATFVVVAWILVPAREATMK
jgi:hypothetical protein